MRITRLLGHAILPATVLLITAGSAPAQVGSYSKAVVEDRIKKVEDGVDEFRKYLDKRGEDVKNNAQTAQNNRTTTRQRTANPATTDARKDQANRTKDELDDAMGDLNSSTNRLRRRFNGAANYMESRNEMENVMEDARRVNQVLTRGNYGTQPARLWAALRTNINELARYYGLTPMAA